MVKNVSFYFNDCQLNAPNHTLVAKLNDVQEMPSEDLKQTILDSSYQVLENQGITAIRMRDLAKSCSCAVGTLYNAFETFEDIHFHLNLRTFKRLFTHLYTALQECVADGMAPDESISKMGWVYIDFAKKETNAWKALFENAPKSDPPKWYIKEVDRQMKQAEKVVQKHYNLTEEKAHELINYFWFAVHGVCSIVLNKRAVIHSDAFVQTYVDHCLRGIYKLI